MAVTRPDRRAAAFLALVAGLLVLLGVVASDGLLNVDEVIYALGVHAMAETGGFTIANGFEAFGSDNQKLWLLVEGPAGLVPQYPAGTALAGAALEPIFGGKALVALNVAAGIGTLIVTHALALRLFGSARIALATVALLAFFTFWAEYVIGHWPHAVSVFVTTLALWLYLDAQERGSGAWRPAFGAGLAIGAGLLFRVDGVLALPAIAAAAILFAARPVPVLAGGLAGLVPPTLLLAWTNHEKFGTWNPLSYGQSGGGTDLSTHGPALAALVLALAALVILRSGVVPRPRARWVIPALCGLLVLALALSPAAGLLRRLGDGVLALFLDATTISDPRPGVQPGPGGTLIFWGFPKKALMQSLPWLGCLALLIGAERGRAGRGITFLLILVATWCLPFLVKSWHGGLGANMRYFLPLLPALAALSAWLLDDLARRVGVLAPRLLGFCALAAFLAGSLWLALRPDLGAMLHQVLSTYLFAATALACCAAALSDRRWAGVTALGLVGLGLGLSARLAIEDVAASQYRRSAMAAHAERAAEIDGPVIFYGAPESFTSAIVRPDQLLATPSWQERSVDGAFLEDACQDGYRVVVSGGYGARLETTTGPVALRPLPGHPDLSEAACTP